MGNLCLVGPGAARRPLLAALVVPLAACAVGPDFIPPAAPITDKFLGGSSRSIKSNSQDYGSWWKAFHDPTLDQLVHIAYDQNLTLLSAGTRVLQARAVLGIAVGSFYPQLQQGTGSLIYTQPSAATPLALPNATPTQFWTDSLAVQAAWELDFWGKFRRGVESADGAYLASIASYDDVLVTLLTYVGIRTTEQLIAIARSNISKQEESLKIAKAKYTGGGSSERDVFQATNVLEQTRAAIPQFTIQLQQDRMRSACCSAFRLSSSARCSRDREAGYQRRPARWRLESRRTFSAAGRMFAPPNWPLWHRTRRSGLPRRSSIRPSVSPARSEARPAPPTGITSGRSSARKA